MMKSNNKYKKILGVISTTINQWDPYDLIASGAPKDEFESEVEKIATYFPRIHSSSDAVFAISEVFSKSFEPKDFLPEKCTEIGNDLYNRFIEAGLVENA